MIFCIKIIIRQKENYIKPTLSSKIDFREYQIIRLDKNINIRYNIRKYFLEVKF